MRFFRAPSKDSQGNYVRNLDEAGKKSVHAPTQSHSPTLGSPRAFSNAIPRA